MSLLQHLTSEENAAAVIDVVLKSQGLTTVPPELTNCVSMELLSLASNSIINVEGDSFTSCVSVLRVLDVSENQIKTITKSLLPARFTALLSLDLSKNLINVFPEAPFLATNAPNLEELNLSENKLTGGIGYVEGLLFLTSLDVSYNNLTSCIIRVLPSLTILDVSHNKIARFEVSAAAGSTKALLKELDLTQNHLTTFPLAIVNTCTDLVELSVAHNTLEVLPPSIANLSKIEMLDVSENSLSVLPSALASLKTLTSFTAVGNKIRDMPAFVLGSWSALTFLDLAHNEIEDFGGESSGSACACSATLRDLNISYNKFKSVPPQLAACQCLTSFNIGHNLLCGSFPTHLLLPNNKHSLEVLIAAGNKFSSIPDDFIVSLVNLKECDFDGNELQRAPTCFPSGLERLYMASNRFPASEVQAILDATAAITSCTDCVTAPQRDPVLTSSGGSKRSKRWQELNAARSSLMDVFNKLQQQQQNGGLSPADSALSGSVSSIGRTESNVSLPYNTF